MRRSFWLPLLALLVPVAVMAQSPAPDGSPPAAVVEQDVCIEIDGPALASAADLLHRLEAGTVSVVLAPCRREGQAFPSPTPSPSPVASQDLRGDHWPTIRRTYPRADAGTLGEDTSLPEGTLLYLRGRVIDRGNFKGEWYYTIAMHPGGGDRLDVHLYYLNLGPRQWHRLVPIQRGDLIEAVARADGNFPPSAVAWRVHVLQRGP